MAIPTVVGVSAAVAASVGTIAPAFPSGYTLTPDDILLDIVESLNTDTVTPPTNWATLTSQTVATGTAPTKYTWLWRRAVTGDTAPTIADAGDHMVGSMMVIRGCKTAGTPTNIIAGTTELTADTTVSIPGMTTNKPDCLVVAGFCTGQNITSSAGATGWANSSLANLTERMDGWDVTGGGFAVVTGEKAAAGVVSATTCTLSLTANFKGLIAVAFEGALDEPGRWAKGIPVGMRWNRSASIAANY